MINLQFLHDRRHEILAIASNHGAFNIRIFGSVARSENQARSDVDFLVEMEDQVTLLDYVGLIQDLERFLGCKVDVAEPSSLHPLIHDRVLEEAIAL